MCSVPGRPVLNAHPVPPKINDIRVLQDAVAALLRAYKRLLFDVVMYDSGACSLEMSSYLKDKGLNYLLCLAVAQPTMRAEAERLLGHIPAEQCLTRTVDLDRSEVLTRRRSLTDKMAGWLDWPHLRTVLRVQSERCDNTTGKTAIGNRYYLTSLAPDRLAAEQWLKLIRRRWAVENENRNTFDSILAKDKRPWIRAPRGMVVVVLLRRLAYKILTLYLSVTLRSEASRAQEWTTLIPGVYAALLKATLETWRASGHAQPRRAGDRHRGCYPSVWPRFCCTESAHFPHGPVGASRRTWSWFAGVRGLGRKTGEEYRAVGVGSRGADRG